MTIRFDHTIIPSTDKERSATFYTEIFGLPPARTEGPFAAVDLPTTWRCISPAGIPT